MSLFLEKLEVKQTTKALKSILGKHFWVKKKQFFLANNDFFIIFIIISDFFLVLLQFLARLARHGGKY